MKPLLALLLAGGQSRRMGQDKGLLQLDGLPVARRLYDLLSGLGLPVRLSLRPEQKALYADFFDPAHFACDLELAIRGPLRGILSAHRLWPEHDLLVVACDMPLLEPQVIERLLSQHQAAAAEADYDYLAFDVDGIQPLCAIYRQEALAQLDDLSQKGQLEVTCPRRIMAAGQTQLFQAASPLEALQFSNANFPEDWSHIQAHLAGLQPSGVESAAVTRHAPANHE